MEHIRSNNSIGQHCGCPLDGIWGNYLMLEISLTQSIHTILLLCYRFMYAVMQNKENNLKTKESKNIKYLGFYFAKILVQFSNKNTFRSILIRKILHKYNTLTYVCVLTEFIWFMSIRIMKDLSNVDTTDLRSLRFILYTTKVHNAIQWGIVLVHEK